MATIPQSCKRCSLIHRIGNFPLWNHKELSYRDKFIKAKNIQSTRNPKSHIGSYLSSRAFWPVGFRAFNKGSESDKSTEVTTFQDLGIENRLHPKLVKTLCDDMNFDIMMPIQVASIRDLIDERANCLAQAKTGTCKTITLLLPAIQTLVTKDKISAKRISLLVISPTRELALQIAKEAKCLLQRFPKYNIHTCIGGSNKEREKKDIIKNCDILIATPGRLLDHLSEPRFAQMIETLDTLVLDEVDRLLDMGYMKDIEQIVSYFPGKASNKRQSIILSATQTPCVNRVANLVLGQNYKNISTIPGRKKLTFEKVLQKLVIVPTFSDLAPALVANIQREVQSRESGAYKTIVFAPTAALADFYGHLLRAATDISTVSVLHLRASQNKRSKTIAEFCDAKNGILVTTEGVFRGIDIPAITDVVQVGLPMSRKAYIHRLGHTFRAGAQGGIVLFLTEAEKFFPITLLADIQFSELPADLNSREEVLQIAEKMEVEKYKKIYQSLIGYYISHVKAMGWTAQLLVTEANKFAKEGLRAPEIPMLTKDHVAKLGLRGMHGFNIKPKKTRKKLEI